MDEYGVYTWFFRQTLGHALNGTRYCDTCQAGNHWLVSCIDNCIYRQANHTVPPICLVQFDRGFITAASFVWFYPTPLLYVNPTRDSRISTCLSSLWIVNDIRNNLSNFLECETRTRFVDVRCDKSFRRYVIKVMCLIPFDEDEHLIYNFWSQDSCVLSLYVFFPFCNRIYININWL